MWNIPDMGFTPERKRALREIEIDDYHPGPIVHDFEALLAYVAEHRLSVSKRHQLLPLAVLADVNDGLAHPIEVRLQRPQLKSYPHIRGLYLLLRATGLGQVQGTASKPALALNDELLGLWRDLNPTERYFCLLETWLLRGDAEILGERSHHDPFLELWRSCLGLLDAIPPDGLDAHEDGGAGYYLRYVPGPTGIALLELFGMLVVERGTPQEGQGWQIARLYRTQIGEAVFALLYRDILSNWDQLRAFRDQLCGPLGALQPFIQPYCPAWKRVLATPEWALRDGTHVFKVSLDRGLWRKIAIPGTMTLDALVSAILDAFGFDSDHLYEFSYRNPLGLFEHVHHPHRDDGPWTSEVRVGDAPLPVGQGMSFLYDFGDSWQFDLALERVDPPTDSQQDAVLLESLGDAPEQYPTWGDGEW